MNRRVYLVDLHAQHGIDVTEISEDSQDDLEGLDASVAHIANLLSTEPADGFHTFLVIQFKSVWKAFPGCFFSSTSGLLRKNNRVYG
ncbi:uncharacterized protein LOC125497588 isoform X2 [Beta vulgaris subsp. vulgaris]|uniref:uncharacterized protein LOC125497588 isoform X2 n=1 Tax=Beta vulgaris subsp. vulgaris TaxID=3555 RepID=UPI0020371E0C|nr:uncharacterized protein LOC125497588 isoform X2 [Beta vulgaris subsp. vulgaris]